MVLPIVILIAIPVFLGITYVPTFDLPEEPNEPPIPESSGIDILYFLLMGIWIVFLLRIIILMKRGTYKITQRY
ncbi:hypothetical protein NKOR_06920 [Candidatus Nitrosopumilus koreensis AR1]|uniref:Uncharacterized protein n=1 Tax=Candidatus Nitrosopumilus koreensis AR1 TaxID=1229908 RepID=K0B8E1_9ARCH|nr:MULTISPECIES: hypothetical protein [Nitrosopumilus]AFS81255.1 hypothetical protein NKOR_06920 [Candidatus Nitrosopumilus koreensis AR1]